MMILKPRDLNKKQANTRADDEKLLLRILQECKQIPKADRLEIRQQVKQGNLQVIEILQQHRKPLNIQNLQVALRKYLLKNKQVREQLLLKQYRHQDCQSAGRTIKPSTSHNPSSLNNNNTDFTHTKPQKLKTTCFSNVKNTQQNSAVKSNKKPATAEKVLWPLKKLRGSKLSDSESSHRSFVGLKSLSKGSVCNESALCSPQIFASLESSPRSNNQNELMHDVWEQTSGKMSKLGILKRKIQFQSVIGENIPKNSGIQMQNTDNSFLSSLQNTREVSSNRKADGCLAETLGAFKNDLSYLTLPQRPAVFQDASSLFTDPRLLQECRSLLSASKNDKLTSTTLWSPSSSLTGSCHLGIALPTEPFLIFSGMYGEDIMKFFFSAENKLDRETFRYRMQEFMSKQSLRDQRPEIIDNYFNLLSENSEFIEVYKFGKVLDEYSMQTPSSTREVFNKINRHGLGFVNRNIVRDPKWHALFDKADFDNRGYVGYWEIYAVRSTWEFIDFEVWFNQATHRGSEYGASVSGGL